MTRGDLKWIDGKAVFVPNENGRHVLSYNNKLVSINGTDPMPEGGFTVYEHQTEYFEVGKKSLWQRIKKWVNER